MRHTNQPPKRLKLKSNRKSYFLYSLFLKQSLKGIKIRIYYMSLSMNILVGNIISLVAGIFLIISLCVNNDKKAYKFQFLNTFTLMFASFFFNSLVGVVTLAVASARLMMVFKGKFTFKWAVFFLVLGVTVGLAVNNLGWIGLIPLIAVIQITICNYAYKDIGWIKLSLIVNEAIYLPYFFLVYDYVSTGFQLLTVTIGCISYIKLMKDRKSGKIEN